MLNHTAGLQNALSSTLQKNPMIMCNWKDTLNLLAQVAPESVPGKEQQYHTLTYGWLCGAIAEVPLLTLRCYDDLTPVKNDRCQNLE